MGSGGLIVQFDRLPCGSERPEISLVGRHRREFPLQVVAVGQTNVGIGIVGVAGQRLSEGLLRQIEAFRSALVPVETPFEVELFSLVIRGRMRLPRQPGTRPGPSFGTAIIVTKFPEHHNQRQHNQDGKD